MPTGIKVPTTQTQLVSQLAAFLPSWTSALKTDAEPSLRTVYKRWCSEVGSLDFDDFPSVVAQIQLFGVLARHWYQQERLSNVPNIIQVVLELSSSAQSNVMSAVEKRLKSCDLPRVLSGMDSPMVYLFPKILAKHQKQTVLKRGVYYTPSELIDFMIEAVDEILRETMACSEGVVSLKSSKGHRLKFLDPAAGTGAFVLGLLEHIHQGVMSCHMDRSLEERVSIWESFVLRQTDGLLDRICGFEIMPVSWAIMHLNLGALLEQQGVQLPPKRFFSNMRCGDALQPIKSDTSDDLYVVIGNPPYKGISSNQTSWITGLLEDYKYVDGVHFSEKKHWLHDDYVKFIRFAQHVIELNGQGILAFVQPHGFLSNPTFRGLRWKLWSSFKKMWVVDLQGNLRRHRGEENIDENIFEIQQGISVSLFASPSRPEAGVLGQLKYLSVVGKRSEKISFLKHQRFNKIDWSDIAPHTHHFDYHFMVPKNLESLSRYVDGFALTDFFPLYTSGIVSARDRLVVDVNPKALLSRISDFADSKESDDVIRQRYFGHRKSGKYLRGDTRGWRLEAARKAIQGHNHAEKIQPISYRPFDTRYIYFDPDMVDWLREPVMQHFTRGENIGLIFKRGDVEPRSAPIFASRHIIDFRSWSRPGMQGGDYVAPLYLYNPSGKTLNINKKIFSRICNKLHLAESDENVRTVVNYVYGVGHHPEYRARFAEFLNFEVPRIPYPESKDMFYQHVEQGERLLTSHCVEPLDKSVLSIEMGKEDCLWVGRFRHSGEKLWLNDTQSVSPISVEVWSAFVGGYQPAQKWLSARKGMKLSPVDVGMFMNLIVRIKDTCRIMFN